MKDETIELLHRIFVVNEQIVRQNGTIMSVLGNPRVTKASGWQELTDKDVKVIVENAQSKEWAVLMAQSTLKEKNA